MTIFLVRHTEYSNPENIFPFHLPVKLSAKGVAHAQRIGGWLKANAAPGLPIYSSPIRRSRQTAEIIAGETGATIEPDVRLIESHCPNLQGKRQPGTERSGASWKVQCTDPTRETSESLQKRTKECFLEKVKEGKDCILVSHGDPLVALYYYLIQKPLVPCLFDDEHFDIYIKRGEIARVSVNGEYRIERFTV